MKMKIVLAALAAALLAASLPGAAGATSYYLDNSIGGASDSNAGTVSGAPWATLVHAATTMVAGDVLYVGSHHSETLVASQIVTFATGNANPPRAFAVDDTNWVSGSPYTPVSADLVDPSSAAFPVYNLSTGNLTMQGGFYIRGMELEVTNASATQNIVFGSSSNQQICERCLLKVANTSASSIINLNAGAQAYVLLKDSQVSFGATGQLLEATGTAEVRGHALGRFLATGSVVPTSMLSEVLNGSFTFDGVDLSAAYTNLVTGNVTNQVLLRNSQIATPTITNGTVTTAAGMIRVEGVANSGTFCNLNWYEIDGTVASDTANFRTGGASCGSAGISYRMTGNSSATTTEPLRAPGIDIGYLSSGASTTISLYFMFDGANNTQGFNSTTLNNNQVWIRVGNPQSASAPIETFTSNKIADLLPSTAAATQGSTGGTWTTSGVTTPETYVMTVTFTPAIGGHYTIYPEAAIAANKIIWIDPQYTCTGNCS